MFWSAYIVCTPVALILWFTMFSCLVWIWKTYSYHFNRILLSCIQILSSSLSRKHPPIILIHQVFGTLAVSQPLESSMYLLIILHKNMIGVECHISAKLSLCLTLVDRYPRSATVLSIIWSMCSHGMWLWSNGLLVTFIG